MTTGPPNLVMAARSSRSWGTRAVAGAIGGLTMGVAARFAMRIFAVDVGHEPAFTVGGTAAILTLGLLIRAGFGMGCGTLRKVLPGPWPVTGVAFATILFLFIQVPVVTAGIDEAALDPGLGFRMFLPVTLHFVLMTALAMSALERRFASSVAQPNRLWSGAFLRGVSGLLVIVGPILSSYGQLLGLLRGRCVAVVAPMSSPGRSRSVDSPVCVAQA